MSDQATQTRTVAVTGATGFVGRYLVRALLDRGHSVRALARDVRKAGSVLPESALADGSLTIIDGDIHDGSSPQRLVEGADACCHLIGIIREGRGRTTFRRTHIEATRAIVKAAQDADPSMRYIHMSALGARPNGVAEYQTSKFAAEEIVRGSSLWWTIFRPGLIHGPDGEFTRLTVGWCRGETQPYIFIPYFTRRNDAPGAQTHAEAALVAPIHVQDIARLFADAIDNDNAVGEVYPVTGSEAIRFNSMLEHIRDHAPRTKDYLKVSGVPGTFAAMNATVAGYVGLREFLPFDAGMARMAMEDSVTSLVKVNTDFDVELKPFRASFNEYAANL